MVDLAQTVNEWKDVESNKEDEQYLGDICFSLRYVPNSGKVSLEIRLSGHFDGILEQFISVFSSQNLKVLSGLNSPELKFFCFNIVIASNGKVK